MKATLVCLALVVAALAHAETGTDVMERVRNRPSPSTTHVLVQMELVDKGGAVSARTVESWTMEEPGGLLRTLIVFHLPASVKDTRFLLVENAGREDDKWIYLPALRRVRRVAAAEGGQSFVGTDFTYDDMSTREVADDRHNLLRDETLEGWACAVVESAAVDRSTSAYSRRVVWVDRASWSPVRAELYDRRGQLEKVLTVERLEKIQGFWTPMTTVMSNVQTGHRTRLLIQKVVHAESLSPDLFTTQFLQTGRLR